MPWGVEMTYSIRGERTHRVTVDATTLALTPTTSRTSRTTTPRGDGPAAPPKPAAGSYASSGRHDDGLLVPPRVTHSECQLRAAVTAAQQAHNAYLTQMLLLSQQQQPQPEAAPLPATTTTTATTGEPLPKRSRGT